MKITSSLKMMAVAAVAMSFTALTAHATVSVTNTNSNTYITQTISYVPVTIDLTIKSLTPKTIVYTNSYGVYGATNGLAFREDHNTTNTNTGVKTYYYNGAAATVSTKFGNADFVAALFTNGILTNGTPANWKIVAQVYGGLGEGANFYAQNGTNLVNIGDNISATFPPSLADSYSSVQTYNSNNTEIGQTLKGSTTYEGPMSVSLTVPTGINSSVHYDFSGLGKGSSSDLGYTYTGPNNSTNFGEITVSGAFSLENGVGSTYDRNSNPETIEGTVSFGASKSVPQTNSDSNW
jgi:hypothetical protein